MMKVLFAEQVEGAIDSTENLDDAETFGNRQEGAASRFLQNKGFGWLLEEDDVDDNKKPLLFVHIYFP